MSESINFKVLPAKAGTCAMCATDHGERLAHNLKSIFYQVRFKVKYKRDPTWADAVAHLSVEDKNNWKEAMRQSGVEFTQNGDPVAEPYAVSDGIPDAKS